MSTVIGMNATLKFDREIDKNKHYISIGGFELSSNGETICFDFIYSYGYVNKEDSRIILFNLEVLDEDVFEKCGDKLTKDFCRNVDHIEEFIIFTGEYDEPEILPVELLNVEFIFDDEERISIKEDVIKEYKLN